MGASVHSDGPRASTLEVGAGVGRGGARRRASRTTPSWRTVAEPAGTPGTEGTQKPPRAGGASASWWSGAWTSASADEWARGLDLPGGRLRPGQPLPTAAGSSPARRPRRHPARRRRACAWTSQSRARCSRAPPLPAASPTPCGSRSESSPDGPLQLTLNTADPPAPRHAHRARHPRPGPPSSPWRTVRRSTNGRQALGQDGDATPSSTCNRGSAGGAAHALPSPRRTTAPSAPGRTDFYYVRVSAQRSNGPGPAGVVEPRSWVRRRSSVKLYMHWDMEGASGLFRRGPGVVLEARRPPSSDQGGRPAPPWRTSTTRPPSRPSSTPGPRADHLRDPPRRGQLPHPADAPGPPRHLLRARAWRPRAAGSAGCRTWTRRWTPACCPATTPSATPPAPSCPTARSGLVGRDHDQRRERRRDRPGGLLRRALRRAARLRPGGRGHLPGGRGPLPRRGHRGRQARPLRRTLRGARPAGRAPAHGGQKVHEAIDQGPPARDSGRCGPALPMTVSIRMASGRRPRPSRTARRTSAWTTSPSQGARTATAT